jgi:hypothetical protein
MYAACIDVSKERISSNFRVENQPSKRPACSRCQFRSSPLEISTKDKWVPGIWPETLELSLTRHWLIALMLSDASERVKSAVILCLCFRDVFCSSLYAGCNTIQTNWRDRGFSSSQTRKCPSNASLSWRKLHSKSLSVSSTSRHSAYWTLNSPKSVCFNYSAAVRHVRPRAQYSSFESATYGLSWRCSLTWVSTNMFL